MTGDKLTPGMLSGKLAFSAALTYIPGGNEETTP